MGPAVGEGIVAAAPGSAAGRIYRDFAWSRWAAVSREGKSFQRWTGKCAGQPARHLSRSEDRGRLADGRDARAGREVTRPRAQRRNLAADPAGSGVAALGKAGLVG